MQRKALKLITFKSTIDKFSSQDKKGMDPDTEKWVFSEETFYNVLVNKLQVLRKLLLTMAFWTINS